MVLGFGLSCRSKGVFLHVLEDNEPALALYSRLGFQTAGKVLGFYDISPASSPGEDLRDAVLLYAPVEVASQATQVSCFCSQFLTGLLVRTYQTPLALPVSPIYLA
jgi:hypothetical protein